MTNTTMQGLVTVLGRIMIATIFLMSAVGNKIPNFNKIAGYMASEGVPLPKLMLAGAIVFLIAGSLSIIVGFKNADRCRPVVCIPCAGDLFLPRFLDD